MRFIFRGATFALMVGVAGCTEEWTNPLSTGPDGSPFYFQQAATGPLVEEIWLSDELEDKDGLLGPEWNGSKIFEVALDNGLKRANLTLRADLSVGACASNLPLGVDCRVAFDKVHISASPDGKKIYAVQRQRPVGNGPNGTYRSISPAPAPLDTIFLPAHSYSGHPIGYWDVDLARFVWMGEIAGLPGGIVLATNSADGGLYIGSASSDRLYRITAAQLAVNDLTIQPENSWPLVTTGGATLDLNGADMAFDAQGTLFVWTNTGTIGQQGLWTVELDGGDPEEAVGTRVGGSSEAYFTGLAFRNAGNGALLGSTAVISNLDLTDDSRIYEIDPATGVIGQAYPMYLNGFRYEHLYGDMSTGRLALPPPAGAVLLIIDEDGIDNGLHLNRTGGNITPAGPSFWTENEVNDDLAAYGFRDVLRYFADSNNFGRTITVRTGQTGDEGWFAPNCIPAKWIASNSPSDLTCLTGAARGSGINNLVFSGKTPFVGAPTSWNIPQSRLDKIPAVMPLRARGLVSLEGKDVCALVYDSDISINYNSSRTPFTDGNLQGATLGIAAFRVNVVRTLNRFSSSTLPEVQITVLNAADTCKNFQLFNAPVPRSSSVPNDRLVENLAGTGSNGYRQLRFNPEWELFF